ncbi:MAG TPA: hypothetical protein VFW33_09960, partial [Gemmataceae bacterium]|nr:hypothetical protein [Gemmataceae bacterium]
MPGDLPSQAGPAAESTPILGCALHWLSASDKARPLSALLAELARAIGVPGAGLAQMPRGEPVAGRPENVGFPWRDRPELLRDVALSPSAVSVRDESAHWLLTAVGTEDGAGWLLWLCASPQWEWSPAQAAALALTGEALARRLRRRDDAPRWAR